MRVVDHEAQLRYAGLDQRDVRQADDLLDALERRRGRQDQPLARVVEGEVLDLALVDLRHRDEEAAQLGLGREALEERADSRSVARAGQAEADAETVAELVERPQHGPRIGKL